MTDGDRVAAALKSAGEQAMRNSNMGQIKNYRINHMISLIERIRAEERERCADIVRKRRLDEHATVMLQEIENGT